MQLAIECKEWSSKLDVADIGSFIDKLKDVGISKGIMVSRFGYTESAYRRARSELGVQLQVLDFDNLPSMQNFWANPYRGNVGAIVSAPNGWLVNLAIPKQSMKDMLCSLNPFEFEPGEAYKRKQFMYFQINSIGAGPDILKLFAEQDAVVLDKWPKSKIRYWEEDCEVLKKVSFRQIDYPEKGHSEFTAGIQVLDFFAYCVYIVPLDYIEDDLARLRYVMNNLILVKLPEADPENSHEAWQRFLSNIVRL